MAISNLSELVSLSDLIAVGRAGIITSTGGSINVEINVDRTLKGSLKNDKMRIVLSTKEATPPPELNPGKLYILFLRALQESNIYALAGKDQNVVISFNEDAFKEVTTLISGKDVD